MTFEKGNRFWEARNSNKGAAPKYESPDDLRAACMEYFEWVAKNPLKMAHPVTFQGKGKTFEVAKMRAMTVIGLCNFIGIGKSTWYDWKNEKGDHYRSDVSDTLSWAEDVITQQKIEGAAADLLNAAFIGKQIGLADKTEHSGEVAVKGLKDFYADGEGDS